MQAFTGTEELLLASAVSKFRNEAFIQELLFLKEDVFLGKNLFLFLTENGKIQESSSISRKVELGH